MTDARQSMTDSNDQLSIFDASKIQKDDLLQENSYNEFEQE
jgi:hypothetical protein